MNKIMLIGNLGKDPDMSYTSAGTAVTRFAIAVNRVTKGPNGEKQKETEWFNVVAWRQLAETCNQYLKKGQKVYVEGRASQRKYTDKNGVERNGFEVVLNEMEMLSSSQSDRQAQPQQQQGGEESFFIDNDLGELGDHPF